LPPDFLTASRPCFGFLITRSILAEEQLAGGIKFYRFYLIRHQFAKSTAAALEQPMPPLIKKRPKLLRI
jgi:hypothetical protein